MGPFLFIVIVLLFLGLCLYALVMPKYMVKRGRKVDARVISCKGKNIEDSGSGEGGALYYVTVDFYGLYGETIVKSFQSETAYSEGDVIRSRYLDKKGLFWAGADAEVKKGPNKGLLLVIGILLLMLALIFFLFFGRDENGNLPGWFVTGFGSLVSVLFIIIGVWGVYKQILIKKNEPNMQTLPGVVADYTLDRGYNDDADSYFPIYEYEWMGEKKRFAGTSGGTNKKYRTIGRRVHIMRDPATGKAFCKEDETGHILLYVVFLFFGIAALVALLFGGFSGEDKETKKDGTESLKTQEDTLDTDKEMTDAESGAIPTWELYYLYMAEDIEKCSYAIQIYDDCSGQVILFPNVTVSGKAINQCIPFEISLSDMIALGQWVESIDYENLSMAPSRDGEEVQICLNLYNSGTEEKYSGGGYFDNEIYAHAFEVIKEVVPKKVWNEMQEREEEYYN